MAKDPNIDNLRKRQDTLLNQLRASTSAGSGQGPVSASDIATNRKLLKTYDQINKARNKQLQEQWYGDDEEVPQAEGADSGFFASTFDKMLRPLYGIVGAADYATGKGEGTLLKSVTENARTTKRTFGNLLEDSGVNKLISAPLGLTLDIAFDPINWATFGTAALIPRIAYGLGKGTVKGGIKTGLKAARAGAESKFFHYSAQTGRLGNALGRIPGGVASVAKKIKGKVLKKGAQEVVEEIPRAVTPLIRKAQERALKATDEYNALVGRDVIKEITEAGEAGVLRLLGSQYQIQLAKQMDDVAKSHPDLKKFFEYFHYDPAKWDRLSRMKDAFTQLTGGGAEMNAAIRALIRSIDEGVPYKQALKEARVASGIAERTLSTPIKTDKAIFDKIGEVDDAVTKGSLSLAEGEKAVIDMLKVLESRIKNQADIVGNPNKFITADHVENMIRIAGETTGTKITTAELKELMKYSNGETGWAWFDKTRSRMLNAKQEIKIGKHSKEIGKLVESTLDGIATFISLFKRAKVGGSGTAWTNAIVGNVVMAKMAGIDILDPLFRNQVYQASKMLRGKTPKELFLRNILENKEVLKTMAYYPDTLKQTTGVTMDMVNMNYIVRRMATAARDGSFIADDVDITAFAKAIGYAADEAQGAAIGLKNVGEFSSSTLKGIKQKVDGVPKSLSNRQLARDAGVGFDEAGAGTSMIDSEFYDSPFLNKIFSGIEKKAKEGNPVFKVFNFMFNKMSRGYETIDQTYKLGTFFHTSIDGVSEASLRIIARNIVLSPSDVTKVGSRYQLSGTKALELSNEIYLNYQAMPAAIRVLRGLPLIGFPFASFTYGMSLKTAKTFANNPALFNKTNLLLDEVSGSKSPLEKGVLSDPRYSYLSEPGMVKLPFGGNHQTEGPNRFFEDHGLYLNVAQMIPYLTLSLFTPANRRYEDVLTDRIVRTLDKFPFIKGPVGATIMDYLILPNIIQSTRPLGQFGQPLYPKDASILEQFRRAFYQGVIDPLTPGIVSPAGYPIGKTLPREIIDYLPSYGLRKTAHAARGESPIGITTSEDSKSKSFRALLGAIGVPLQAPVDFKYLPKDLEKQVKRLSK